LGGTWIESNTRQIRCWMPIKLLLAALGSIISGRRRNFHQDCRWLSRCIQPKPVILGKENILGRGPFLVTLNHYSRPGFFILWAAAAINAALPKSSIWLMTGAWTSRKGGFDRLRTWLTGKLFARLAQIYGLVTMPPMPPAPGDSADRALSVRRLLQKMRAEEDAIVCIAPEGMDFPGGLLGAPFPGTGKLLLQTARLAGRVLPVGVFEENERLVIRFGKPYVLTLPEGTADVDRAACDEVMRRIAALLPEGMRGEYG